MSDRVGQQLGNYRLLRLLGRGGFAEVYLGEHLHLDTQAAIKVLRTQLSLQDIERFRMEARAIAHLEHPNIVRILEFGVEDHVPFLVMSYASHGSLRDRHPRRSRVQLMHIVTYAKQVASALQHAHDAQLIHRDVKPENLLLGRNGEVLLSDFGLVILIQSSESQTTKEMAGTVPYTAPEQLQGKPRKASDQYSLGVVVYEWLSGVCPFQGSALEIATQHLYVPPPPLREKDAMIPSVVEEVVLTALAKDPQRRFASVQAFAMALDHAYQTALKGNIQLPGASLMDEDPAPDTWNSPRQDQSTPIAWTRRNDTVEQPSLTDASTIQGSEHIDTSKKEHVVPDQVSIHVPPDSIFLFNQALPDPSEFYGRARERRTLLNRTRNGASTSIVGPRRGGKTWLMVTIHPPLT